VEDVALMLGIIAGYDDLDPTTADVPVPDYLRGLNAPTSRLRLGIPRTPFFDGLDPDVERAATAAIEVLKKLTSGTTVDIVLPPSGNPATIWGPEALVYHAKGIVESPEKYQPGTRAALQRSMEAKATDYVRARRQVETLRREIRSAFTSADLLITPTMKMPAPLLGSPGAAGGGNNNAAFDVFGIPTISIPIGFSASGMPIGLQISGAPFAEPAVLALAHAYEHATDWHTRKPPLAR
jgi:aspartyl-tRNA(Asn)/glutamyl-tRNA(Gln) amidotransferase subunit A